MNNKYKFMILAPIAALLIVFIFTLTLFPSVQPTITNLPLAIINEDEGITLPDGSTEKAGNQIVQMIKQMSEGEETAKVKWTELDSLDAMNDAFKDKTYYAALYIPADFSKNRSSLLTPEPLVTNIEIYINQGLNPTAATMATQLLNTMVTQFNQTIQSMMFAQIEQQGLSLNATQAQVLANPIQAKTTILHPVGENSANGNSPVSLFQPTWIGSMIVAILLFLALNKLKGQDRKQNLLYQTIAIVIGIISSLLIGLALTSLAKYMVGITITNFAATTLFISLASLAFITLLLTLLSYIGFVGMPIFILLLFFGAPLLAVPPEMMSDFYSHWVYPWLPMRFMVEGLREIFFFDTGLSWSASTATLTYIAISGILLILLAAFKKKKTSIVGEQINAPS